MFKLTLCHFVFKILLGISFLASLGSELAQIGYFFIARFVSAPFRSWLASFGHVVISGIVTVLLAHGRFDTSKFYGNLAFHGVLHKTTPMTKTPLPLMTPPQLYHGLS